MVGIYKITDGRFVYIGQSINIKKRWRDHISVAFNGGTGPLYEAMRDHLQLFTFSVELICDKKDLNQEEKRLIEQYNCLWPNGYNRLSGSSKYNKAKLNNNQIQTIQQKLIAGYSIKQICQEFQLSHQMVYSINNGKSYYDSKLQYPLHIKKQKQDFYCKKCGKPISQGSCFCKKCRPRDDQLNYGSKLILEGKIDLLEIVDYIIEHGYKATYVHYDVGRKTLRKFLINHMVPYCKKDLALFYKTVHNIVDEPLEKKHKTITSLNSNGYKVAMLDIRTNEIIHIFNSCLDAAVFLGDKSKNKHISSVACGSRQTAYGFKWKYI